MLVYKKTESIMGLVQSTVLAICQGSGNINKDGGLQYLQMNRCICE